MYKCHATAVPRRDLCHPLLHKPCDGSVKLAVNDIQFEAGYGTESDALDSS